MALTPSELDEKYKIKRPTYDDKELHKLQALINEEKVKYTTWMDEWLHQKVLIRFLKAFLKAEDTFEALKKYYEWRAKYDVDNISEEDDKIKAEDSHGRGVIVNGVCDRYLHPVVIVYPYCHDKYHNDYESLYKYIIFKIEKICKICEDENNADQFCLIVDLKQFSLRNMDYNAIKKIIWFLKNCYPERLGVCLIINYPWLFCACWEYIKSWLNDVTRSKIIFCGQNELSDFLDLNSFPIPLLQDT